MVSISKSSFDSESPTLNLKRYVHRFIKVRRRDYLKSMPRILSSEPPTELEDQKGVEE